MAENYTLSSWILFYIWVLPYYTLQRWGVYWKRKEWDKTPYLYHSMLSLIPIIRQSYNVPKLQAWRSAWVTLDVITLGQQKHHGRFRKGPVSLARPPLPMYAYWLGSGPRYNLGVLGFCDINSGIDNRPGALFLLLWGLALRRNPVHNSVATATAQCLMIPCWIAGREVYLRIGII